SALLRGWQRRDGARSRNRRHALAGWLDGGRHVDGVEQVPQAERHRRRRSTLRRRQRFEALGVRGRRDFRRRLPIELASNSELADAPSQSIKISGEAQRLSVLPTFFGTRGPEAFSPSISSRCPAYG